MLELPTDFVYERIIGACRLAQEAGAKIVGLGAFTSVVGDGGITIAKHMDIAITTGNSYTIATAIEGGINAAERMGINVAHAHAAVVGATGSIGRTCAIALADQVQQLTLVGRNEERLQNVASVIKAANNPARIVVSTDVKKSLSDADIIITVTSAVDTVIEPEYLKPGAVVCDVARPRDVSRRVVEERDDVLVIEGGVVEVPGEPDFHFNFGFPPQTAYACMSETMMLALDQRYENFTLGKEVSIEQVRTTHEIAKKHGFRLAGWRSFEHAVSDETIERVRANAARKRVTIG
jgi:predicted amino acid dehydrogenase